MIKCNDQARRFLIGMSLGLAVGCSGSPGATTSTQEDKNQITSLINSAELRPYLPSGITSDGGVVFATSDTPSSSTTQNAKGITSDGAVAFVTLALRPAQAGAGAAPDDLRRQQQRMPSRHVGRFGRTITAQDPLQLEIQIVAAGRLANASVISTEKGNLEFQHAEDASKVRHKQFKERHSRRFSFLKLDSRWLFQGVSPVLTLPSDVSQSDIQITRLVISVNGQLVGSFDSPDQTTAAEALPILRDGDQVKVEVTASSSDGAFDPPFFVFLHRPGADVREHMLDDGSRTQLPAAGGTHATSGDQVAADGVFTRTFVMHSDKGIHNLTADVISAVSINSDDETNYHSAAFSVTVKVL